MNYLILYNQFSAILWLVVFFNTIFLGLGIGQPVFFAKTANLTTIVQSFAIIEVFNSAAGIIKSPLFTTVSQVSSRLLVVFGIFQTLPGSPACAHWSYITLSLAWSITEIIRYLYYAQNISTGGHPAPLLTRLRYNLFFVLYPMGVGSELTMVLLSLGEAEKVVGPWYKYFLIAVVAIYAPGFYILFTHMIKQRSKALRALQAPKAKAN